MSKRKHGEVANPDTPLLRPMTFVLPTISPIKLSTPHPQAEEALLLAASSGNLKMVKYLVGLGVDINCQDKISAKTPLMRALWNERNDVAKTLITKNADLNIQDNFSNTALFLAASRGNIEIVETIISAASIWEEVQYKAFLDQPHRMYGSSLQVALGNGDAKMVKVLVNAGARVPEGMHLKAFNIFSTTMDLDEISAMLAPDVSKDKPWSLLPLANEVMQTTLMLSDSDDDSQLSGYIADIEPEY